MVEFRKETLDEVEALFARYPKKENALLPVLHLAQRDNGGWLPQGWDEYIAGLVGTTVNHVRGVISFYNMYKTQPVGHFHFMVCSCLPCGLCGGVDLMEMLEEKLGIHPGQTSEDGLFSLEEAQCLAACDKAPMMMVNAELHGHVSEDDVDRVISRARAERP